jgi:hypothetical protein
MGHTLPPTTVPLPGGRTSNVPSLQTFGALSNFLRSALADEDSRQFSEGMAAMAAQGEAVVAGLRGSRHPDVAAPLLMDMLTVVREHRNFVLGLGLAWRGLYEYPAYLQALNNFRVLIGQWVRNAPGQEQLAVTVEDFELVAWRTMGDGMLLVEMYERWVEDESPAEPGSALDALTEPQMQGVLQWWHRLRR